MASQNSSLNQRDRLATEEDLQRAFAALARVPAPLRPEYAAQLRGTLRDELASRAARPQQPWWRRFVSSAPPVARPAHQAPPRAGYGLRLAMAAVGAVLILVLATALVTELYPLGSSAQVATLSVRAGEVEIARPVRIFVDTGLMRRLTASSAEPVRLLPGDELVSDPAADAEIALPDGSKMAVGPGVQLTIEELQARTAAKPLVVAMRLERGEVRSQVEHLRADQDRFQVSTPNLVAQVRGTIFRVDVRRDTTRVATDRGLVRVQWAGQSVDVAAGRELVVLPGQPGPRVEALPQSPTIDLALPAESAEIRPDGEQVFFTKKATIPIAIHTLPGAQVEFVVNDVAVARAAADADGRVTVDFPVDAEGEYRITAVIETPAGDRSLPAPARVLVVDRTPPALALSEPAQPQVKTSTVLLSGVTTPGAQLVLNRQPLSVDAEGRFTQKLRLSPGPNQLVLIATDRAGNSVTLQSVVILE